MTYTCAKLEVSKSTFDEIKKKLEDAGYDHVFTEEGIDMTHIMLTPEPVQEQDKPACPSCFRTTIVYDANQIPQCEDPLCGWSGRP